MAVIESIDLGPGVLKIGETGSEIDASCLVNNVKIATSKNTTDPRTMLCGDVKPGKTTYTFTIGGNVDTDVDDAAGLFALSQSAAGTQQPFTFTPNTAVGTTATGTLTLDPLDFGADETGAPLQSDFEFDCTEQPTYAYGTPAP